jgi:hypothetical protein
MQQKSNKNYLLRDMNLPVSFQNSSDFKKQAGTIEIKFTKDRLMESGVFYY